MADDEALSRRAPPGPLPQEAGRADDSRSSHRGHRRLWVGVTVVVTAGLVAATLAWSRPVGRPSLTSKDGGPAVPFQLENVRRGEPGVSLASYRDTPVVLNFWASWCVPCREELAHFQAVAHKVRGRVAFVGVNHQDSREPALQLLEETGVAFPSGYDPDGKVAVAYGLLGMPSTLYISAGGTVLERRTGQTTQRELEQAIRRLFPS